MKKNIIIANIIFYMTLISPVVSFSLSCLIGEPSIFGVAGIVRYSWIMWLFIPIGILSIIVALNQKKNNQNYKKNIIIAFVCLPILMLFGSYRLIFSNVSYDTNSILNVEEKTKIELPDNIKVVTIESESYIEIYAKVIEDESKNDFETKISNNPLWQKELDADILLLLPINVLYEIKTFDYFVFYNVTYDEYNKYSSKEEYKFIYIAYDKEKQRLFVLNSIKNGD